jgi:serine/threonine protein kinase
MLIAVLFFTSLIYRDLKPDNIGFDVRGDLKIFDFGLCREFDPSKATKDGTYKLTGDTGSTRYMAPEVALDKPYNETADVYSYGILFYQIMSMETPFSCLTVKNFPNMVFTKGARPVPDPKWPATVSDLMRKCWSANIKERPSMEDVASILLEEINANSDEEIFDIMDVSRKSELSLRGH